MPQLPGSELQMRELPLVFPLALIAIVVTLAFYSVYAVADTAEKYRTEERNLEWHQDTALLICPFH